MPRYTAYGNSDWGRPGCLGVSCCSVLGAGVVTRHDGRTLGWSEKPMVIWKSCDKPARDLRSLVDVCSNCLHARTRHDPFGTGAQVFRKASRLPFWTCHSHKCALTHSSSAVHASAHEAGGTCAVVVPPQKQQYHGGLLLLMLALPVSLTPPSTQCYRPAREGLVELGGREPRG